MSIQGVLLDLSGVLYTGNKLLPNALESIKVLEDNNIPHQFITNTTRKTRDELLQSLATIGLKIHKNQLFTAPLATKKFIQEHHLNPFLLIHPNLFAEFSICSDQNFDSVVIGDAGEKFTYKTLNKAFRILMQGVPLYAMGDNRYFKEEEGLSLDAGAFVRALEYSADTKAIILGKPSKEFFLQAIKEFNCPTDHVVMIGDDVDADVNGATNAGIKAILVQTGKYQVTDDERIVDSHTRIANDIFEAVNWIIHDL